MQVKDIKNGDIITYRSGRINRVNKDFKYHNFYNNNFENIHLPSDFDIMRIQRYVKVLWFYSLKTIYRRY